MSTKVFINRKLVSEDAAAVLLKLFPNGGMFAEETVYKKIRSITVDMLPKGSTKTPTLVRKEIDRLISEELTVKISIEGLTCEKCERKPSVEDEHQKAMKKLADLAKVEHEETLNKKKAIKAEPLKDNVIVEEKEEPVLKKEKAPIKNKSKAKQKPKSSNKKSTKKTTA